MKHFLMPKSILLLWGRLALVFTIGLFSLLAQAQQNTETNEGRPAGGPAMESGGKSIPDPLTNSPTAAAAAAAAQHLAASENNGSNPASLPTNPDVHAIEAKGKGEFCTTCYMKFSLSSEDPCAPASSTVQSFCKLPDRTQEILTGKTTESVH